MAATLHFFCPTTHQQVPTGIKTDVQGLRASWRSTVSVDCKHCGQVHELSVRDTYLSGALIAAAHGPSRYRYASPGRYFGIAVTNRRVPDRARSSKAARALYWAALERNCRTDPVPFITYLTNEGTLCSRC